MALTEALMLPSSAIPAAKFSDIYADLLQVSPGKRKRNLDAAFQVHILFYLLFSFLAVNIEYLLSLLFRLLVFKAAMTENVLSHMHIQH